MKLHYSCDYCDDDIDIIEVSEIDEAKFGFDCLTPEERQAIIKIDMATDTMYVKALCDKCIEALNLKNANDLPNQPVTFFTH